MRPPPTLGQSQLSSQPRQQQQAAAGWRQHATAVSQVRCARSCAPAGDFDVANTLRCRSPVPMNALCRQCYQRQDILSTAQRSAHRRLVVPNPTMSLGFGSLLWSRRRQLAGGMPRVGTVRSFALYAVNERPCTAARSGDHPLLALGNKALCFTDVSSRRFRFGAAGIAGPRRAREGSTAATRGAVIHNEAQLGGSRGSQHERVRPPSWASQHEKLAGLHLRADYMRCFLHHDRGPLPGLRRRGFVMRCAVPGLQRQQHCMVN